VALLGTDVSEESIASIIRVTRFGKLETTLAVTGNRRALRGKKTNLRSVLRLLVIANVVPSSPNLVTLVIEAIRSSETSALRRATRHHIPEDGILHV
jgi:hypothetical protein